jgi:serine/threonine-protein kinase
MWLASSAKPKHLTAMPDLTGRLTTALADRYRIEQELGHGGMATVHLAEDLKHKRKVAVKVLRPELAAVLGAERFVHEITTTASLQHPHILPLFDSGEADGFLYYVMPFIEGETLREKLDREKQLSIDEAVRITTEVADALDYAHRNDVIHRDIKPENILLHDGRPMVADFGIALAVSVAAGGRMTETGLSLGTPHYMSPEQATAEKDLTNRSDIYSLGAVLYEMLTGSPPHTGSSAQQIIMKIVTEEVQPVTELRRSVPPNVAAAVAKALEKLAADRFAAAVKFREALTNVAFTLPGTTGLAAAGQPIGTGAWWKRYAWPAAAAALAGLALLGWLRPEPPPSVARYGLQFPVDQEFIDDFHPAFALAPDGSWIVYVGQSEDGDQLWVKRRDQYRATPLAGSAGARSPVVSPDGAWIAFIAEGELRKVPVDGGSAITLTDSVQTGVRTAAWLDDGSIVFTDNRWRLSRVPGIGGPMEVVWADSAGRVAILPVGLPDARGVLFTLCTPGCNTVQSWVLDLRSGEARMLIPEVAQSWYVATGHLVSVRPDGGVVAVPFDLGSLARRGAPVPVLDGIKVDRGIVPDFTLSKSGTLLLAEGTGGGGILTEAVWVDRVGAVTPVDPDWTFNAVGIAGWALSPDGTRLAIKILGETGDDIWIKQLPRGSLSRLTFDESPDVRPRWTPDGRSVSFRSPRAGDGEL